MHIYQRFDVVAQRHKYLRKITHFRALGYSIYFQDETWCNANHTREYIWQQSSDPQNLLSDTEWKGGLKWERWWQNSVLPNLKDKSIVVIDNAKYHSRQTDESKAPTTSWKKDDIRTWLTKKGIQFESSDTRPILLARSKELVVPKKYVLEESTAKFCETHSKDIKILRLPVGHSELNPIELIWAQAKTEVARRNTTFKISDVQELMLAALGNVTPRNWLNAINHTKKVEQEFCKLDFGDSNPIYVEDVVINITASDKSDTEYESSDQDEWQWTG